MFKLLGKQLQAFKRDERGSFSIFIVVIFTTLILVGGAAIDFIRYEAVRSSIQYNLDRAVLAAASMRQTQTPTVIVLDYMSKVETLSSFDVNMDAANTSVSATGRRVSATATADISTYFLKLAGVSSMAVSAASSAAEEIPNLEISLVLDISGSMLNNSTSGGSKIGALKTAANTFIDTMIDPNSSSVTSISIVPYASNVTLPQNMWDLYSTEGLHTNRRCITFPSGDFSSAAISTTVAQRQLSYFKTDSVWFGTGGGGSVASEYNWCNDASYAEILPFETNSTTLKTKITNLSALGGTATHTGAKWGLGLLDPAAAGVASSIGSAASSGRPTAYHENGVLKVLVIMTDGQNSNHADIADGYRSGPSHLYLVREQTGDCSAALKIEGIRFVRGGHGGGGHGGGGHGGGGYGGGGYGGGGGTPCTTRNNLYTYNPSNGYYYPVSNGSTSSTLPGDANAVAGEVGYRVNYTWQEVWETYSTNTFANMAGKNESTYRETYATSSESNTALISTCNTAKSNDVIVFTVAFEAPTNAETLLRNCATSDSHYYDVNGADIATAFASIAVTVTKLRLTQ